MFNDILIADYLTSPARVCDVKKERKKERKKGGDHQKAQMSSVYTWNVREPLHVGTLLPVTSTADISSHAARASVGMDSVFPSPQPIGYGAGALVTMVQTHLPRCRHRRSGQHLAARGKTAVRSNTRLG
jgi:hypothetical protein